MRPIWKRADVDENKRYVLILFENSQGVRDFALTEIGCATDVFHKNEDSVFLTKEIPHELALSGNLLAISQKVTLESGEPFYFDAHGIWLTKDEREDIIQGRAKIRWVRGRVPAFAPK